MHGTNFKFRSSNQSFLHLNLNPTMDQFILFGDSITQQIYDPNLSFSLGAALSNDYIRRLEIINRGLSGYNTEQALQVLEESIPRPETANVRFLTIFFGANDARLPNMPGGPDQHVPVDKYKANLRAIITHPRVQEHVNARIILIAPPPLDEATLLQTDQVKYPGLIGDVLRRTNATTRQYATAVRELGCEMELPVIDLGFIIYARLGRPLAVHGPLSEYEDAVLRHYARQPGVDESMQTFLHDGLHLSGEGYKLLYLALTETILLTWPDQTPGQLPLLLPAWDDIAGWEKWKAR
ncbi:isoamyl acetate-hydrolyzing esterase 1 like protein [Acrodontium crateriforme]|uniref:Isoamyl acetate-hydrolyzing esterase 1 like protein n=1 Tax=Acrodontium crateriforme TaxID=150365 RepID=A0AAQ3MDX9_9PEZI|nr:isoamyl acetate-hydrolyzing esterase 1 like protein [Acrodontium crateriforme]